MCYTFFSFSNIIQHIILNLRNLHLEINNLTGVPWSASEFCPITLGNGNKTKLLQFSLLKFIFMSALILWHNIKSVPDLESHFIAGMELS